MRHSQDQEMTLQLRVSTLRSPSCDYKSASPLPPTPRQLHQHHPTVCRTFANLRASTSGPLVATRPESKCLPAHNGRITQLTKWTQTGKRWVPSIPHSFVSPTNSSSRPASRRLSTASCRGRQTSHTLRAAHHIPQMIWSSRTRPAAYTCPRRPISATISLARHPAFQDGPPPLSCP